MRLRSIRIFALTLYVLLLLGAKELYCTEKKDLYQIVFIHIGPSLPPYIKTALAQARLFNEECPIVLIANAEAIKNFSSSSNISLVSCESLPLTDEHKTFQRETKFSDQINGGYLRYTSERFFYLYDYMIAYETESLFHLESDVLLYTDLKEPLSLFKQLYPGIATTFENEFKGIAGFVFIHRTEAMKKLVRYFIDKAPKRMNDMAVLGAFWREHSEVIDCLPMIMRQYFFDTIPKQSSQFLKRKLIFCNHIDEFISIFDGATIGVFFDGLDPAKGNFPTKVLIKQPFDPSLIDYRWIEDDKGRRIPYIIYKHEAYKINNLHIASKRLEKYTSEKL